MGLANIEALVYYFSGPHWGKSFLINPFLYTILVVIEVGKMHPLYLIESENAINSDGKEQVLRKDQQLPKSRGCPTRYKIQDVYLYDEKSLAVFLKVFSMGFEGDDRRYLVVTGFVEELLYD